LSLAPACLMCVVIVKYPVEQFVGRLYMIPAASMVLYYRQREWEEVARMRDMNRKMTVPRRMLLMAIRDWHKMMMRRSVNRNAHIITPHGKMMAGRKGRKG